MYDENGEINHELVSGDPSAQAEDLKWWTGTIKAVK